MYPYGVNALAFQHYRNGVHGAAMNSKPVKKRAIQAWRDGDMTNEYSVYQEQCLSVNGGWHMDHSDRPEANRNLDNMMTWSPSSVSECPSQTDSEVDSDINTSLSHSTPENTDASFYGDEKKKKRTKKKQLAVVLDRIVVNKAEKQKVANQELVRIPGLGVASERKTSQQIQPIILDFEVPLPKELPPKTQANKDESSLKRNQNSPDSQSLSEEPSTKKQCNEKSLDSSKESNSSPTQTEQSSKKEESDTDSKKPPSTEELFKKPDINQYKASTGGVRCFICQRQIITDGKETAFFGMVVCVPCKKIQESGGPALPTPVPKFPTSCHPKLFRGSKYVRSNYGRSSRSPSPARSRSGSRSPGRSPATSPIPRSPVSPYRSNPVSPFSRPPSSPAMSSPRQLSSMSATPPASPKTPAPQLSDSTPVLSTSSLETSSSVAQPVVSISSIQQTHVAASQSRSVGTSPSYHSVPPLSISTQSLPSSPLHINVSSPERSLVPSPSHAKSDKVSPPRMEAMQVPAGMHRPPRILTLATPCSRPPEVELPNNNTIQMSEVHGSSQVSSESSQQNDRTHQEHETIRALLKLRRQDQQQSSISGPPPLIQTSASRGVSAAVGSTGPTNQLPPGLVPSMPSSPRSMYPTSIPQGFIPSPTQGGFPRIQMMPLQRMPVEAFIPRSDISAVQNHMLQPPTGNIRYPGVDPMKSIPVPKIADVRTLNPAMTNMPMFMHGYSANMSKRQRKKKNAVIIENLANNQVPHGQYRGEKPTDQSGKEPLVIVGTNCGTGSSSIKVGNDKEPQEPYIVPGQSVKPVQDGFSRLLAFHCVCQGRPVTFIQCPNCDFICNSIDGMELHFAAQRHAEIRGDKESSVGNTGKYLVESSDVNGKPSGDDVVSLSSMETQSADTDSEMPSPKNMQENWRILNQSSDLRYEKHKSAYNSALDLRVAGSKPGELSERPTPLDLSQKQAISLTGRTPQMSSGQIENTVPLDLSSHIENARLASIDSGREAFGDANREAMRMVQHDLYMQGPPRRPSGLELHSNKPYLTQSQLESEARARMVLVDSSPLYSISRGGKDYNNAGPPGVMQLVRPPRNYPLPTTVTNRDLALFPGTEVTNREIAHPPRMDEYRHVLPPPHLIHSEQQRINAQRSASVTVQQLLRAGPPPQRASQQEFHPGYPVQDGMGVSLPLPNLVRAQPRATIAPLVSQPCQISYQGGTISVHATAQQLQQQQDNLRDLQKLQREEFERQANLHKEMSERRVDSLERQEKEKQIHERERQREMQEAERQHEIQMRERHRSMQEQHMDMQSKQRNNLDRQIPDRELAAKVNEIQNQPQVHEFHRGPKGKHRRLEFQNNRMNHRDSIKDIQSNKIHYNDTSQNTEKTCSVSDSVIMQRNGLTPTDIDSNVQVKSEPVTTVVEDKSTYGQSHKNGPTQPVSENNNDEDSRLHLAESEQYQVNSILKQETVKLTSA